MDYSAIFTVITDPKLVALLFLGVLGGMYIGAIPGLSGTMAASLLISFTYSWDVLPALAVMVGVHVGAVYGGSRSAILLNIPGAPAAIATAMEGYPLAKKGQAAKAIGITVMPVSYTHLFPRHEDDAFCRRAGCRSRMPGRRRECRGPWGDGL